MNKFSKLLMGVAALGLAACSNDEPIIGGNGEVPAKGDVAYLNITITSADDAAGSKSRATTGSVENKEYIYGDAGENEVISANFYFYDAAGNFVMEANRWTGGHDGNYEEDKNVEYIGDNTVVLENLDVKNYPTWMVTILNQPENFTPGRTLDEMGKIVLDSWDSGNKNGRFIMTTSSYFGDDNKDEVNGGWRYFATKLNKNNFYQQTPEQIPVEDKDRVQVYVERLAARVGVDMKSIANEKGKNQYTDPETGKSYDIYRIDASVAGGDNPSTGEDTEQNPGAAATKLYVAITGWDLNTTAKRTNLMKDLTDWTDKTTFGAPDWNWNNADYHRSYWGKSYTYGVEGDALNGANGVLNTSNGGWISLDQTVGTKLFNGTRVYCNENTNLIGNLTDNGTAKGNIVPNKTTSVLLRAVVCDENGNPMQLVKYLGINFLKSSFVAKALEIANPSAYYTRAQATDEDGTLLFWPDGTPKYEYTGISVDDVKVISSDQGTGSVRLAVNDGTYYILTGIQDKKFTEEDGTELTWTVQTDAVANNSDINAKLATATNGTSNKAVAYTDGAMYYPIPVEHLHQPASTSADKVEGQFGVVRNHVYNISISKIKTLGEGVFVPKKVNPGDEIENLDPDTPKEPTYYVESAINILSWKVVSQEVEI